MYDTARRVALVKQRVRENARQRQRREAISLSAAWTGTNGKARRAFVSKLFFGNNLQKQRYTNSVLSIEFVCLF